MLPATILFAVYRDCVVQHSLSPVRDARRWNGQRHFHGKTDAWMYRCRVRPRKECEIGPGIPVGIRVEQMVGVGRVLVNRLLHESHAEHARVKIEVRLCIASNGGDVMDSGYLIHGTRKITVFRNGQRWGSS